MSHRYAVVTLVTSDSYLAGALVALNSLLDAEGAPTSPTARRFATVCLATPATLGHATLQALDKAFDQVVGVEQILTKSWEELKLLGRQDLAATLTKLHVFRLTQFEKVIFLDADTLVLRPISSLFQLPHRFAAAPDVGWPDAFNSGVFVTEPSHETFEGLRDMIGQRGTWDGGDQGLLNDYFHDWHRLSFTYNVTPTAYYTYAPAYKRHGQDACVLHFIGADKPWNRGTRDVYIPNAASKDYYSLVQQWFDVFERHYGTVSTWDVARKVVAPPSYVRKAPISLPKLAERTDSPGQLSVPTTPTLVLSPPSPQRAPSPPSGTSQLPPPIPIVGGIPVKRVPSPPQLTWDASRSSPPRDGPPQMREPVPYSTNVWDLESKRAQKQRFEPPTHYPPPPTETHDWYRDILQQKPDPSKVKAVFPWEETATTPSTPAAVPDRPPPMATRTFSEESTSSAAPGSFARTGAGSFTNAWDTVPGIKRYVEGLSKVGRSRKSSNVVGSAPRGGNSSSGGNASSSASGGVLAPRPPAGDRTRQHRRRSSGGSATGSSSAAFGFTPASGQTSVSSPRPTGGSSSGSRQHPSAPFTKEGDASSRDGDDEEDEDADVSTATDGDATETDEARVSHATSSERDSDEGIDKIAIKFRRSASHSEWVREASRDGGMGSTDESDDAATLRSVPASPGKTRRPEPRFVPTSPRQPRSPHLTTSPHLSLPSALTRPSLHSMTSVDASTLQRGPVSPRLAPVSPRLGTPVSPRLAAQALRNSTAARLTASGSGSGDGPPIVRATRVFRPETDTSNVKQQGLAALQRFVENMEASAAGHPGAGPPPRG